ncbi:Serine/threonine-protein phosphatase 6 regulatory ankyrin repeat subunit C [Madurella mycetomatis]|uniref:Serine/threonine-protein phosphatase 6 regulatory ankyrin repeat subunit C n=1 Tax=Madurella mycetomatis TaxID=100816 RepID=A0A175VS35_9PEZI|nr:Serine/threonine-protein phosphatase 6 regulatory ankyrin repeat subunit C [Madurella mycetomatis]
MTVLMLAIKAPREPGKVDLVSHLLSNGWPANAADGRGETLLHGAIQSEEEDIDLVQRLLDRDANPNSRNNGNETPLHVAARKSCAASA